MSHVKAGGKTRQHATRPGKRLGVKIFGSQSIKNGQIIVRQKGTKYHPGKGVGIGRDKTIYAKKDGSVEFSIKHQKNVVNVV